jgi:membrane fusion protein, heavy metal efflux system
MSIRLAFVLAAGLCMLAGCGRLEENALASRKTRPVQATDGRIVVPSDSPQLGRIRVAAVETASFGLNEVVVPGKVEVNPNRISRVAPPVAGRVRQVLVKLGDPVVDGQPLVAIESPEAGAAMAGYAQAQAEIRQARSALGKAESDLARLRDLHEHRAAALKDVLAAENELAQTQAGLEQTQAAGEEALHRLQMLGLEPGRHTHEVVVRAPIAGKVLEIAVAPGEFRNDASASLMTIADLRSVWIAAQVPESEIRHIRMGEAVHVELAAYPGDILHAKVMRIADSVDPLTRTIKVQAEIANPAGRLLPEMFGQIRHSHGEQVKPAVPAAAVIQTGGKLVVLVEEGPGLFREQMIRIGDRHGNLLPVLEGVEPGQRIVVDGAILLHRPAEPQ